MTDDELRLVLLSFRAPESVYEKTARFRWLGKLGKAGNLAFNAILPERSPKAHRATGLVGLQDVGSERFKAYEARVHAAFGPLDSYSGTV